MQGAFRMMGRFDVLAKKSVIVILLSLVISLLYFYFHKSADAILLYFMVQSVSTACYLYMSQAKKRSNKSTSQKSNKGSEAANAVISILKNGPKKI